MDVNVDRKDESVEQMDVYMNRWTCSPPLSIHMSYREKRYDFVLRQRGLSQCLEFSRQEKKKEQNQYLCVCVHRDRRGIGAGRYSKRFHSNSEFVLDLREVMVRDDCFI